MDPIKRNHNAFIYKWLTALGLISLAACSAHVDIKKPLDVSKTNQVAVAQFTVRHTGSYRFSLMFLRPKTLAAIKEQENIIGDQNNSGIPINFSLQIKRDNLTIFDQIVTSTGVEWGRSFSHHDQKLNVAVRLIKITELTPGDYTITVKTLKDAPQFKNIKSYIEFTYYNPKH